MKEIIKFFIYGIALFFGFLFASLFIISIYPSVKNSNIVEYAKSYINKYSHSDYIKPPPSEPIKFVYKEKKPPINYINYNPVFINSTSELISKLNELNKNTKPTELILAPGNYILDSTIYINTSYVKIRSLSNSPVDTVISGEGMYAGEKNLFRVEGDHITFENVTLEKASLHLIQVAGEKNSSFLKINGCILRDSYQQFVKISYEKNTPNNYSSSGEITNSIFYFTGKIAPNYYTGGIDGHGVRNWSISRNIFINLASPSNHISEHAIHLWNNSAFNNISDNLIINSDRGIGLGLGKITHPNIIHGDYNSKITGNIIVTTHSKYPFFDAGITLESAAGTKVSDNYIYLSHNYPRAIEYRFSDSKDIIIENNRTNKSITSRDFGEATLIDNIILNHEDDSLQVINNYLINYDFKRRLPNLYKDIIEDLKDD